ncbi:MAG TPA: MFS transporter, partial [Candidatus Saccharimonadales bacterium]|nr:MFS transporter [Candidatus Saccharimonadales bacterium]
MSDIQKTVIAVAILASFVAFLDGSVVNVALPAMMRNLGGGLMLQQWVVDAYLITLGALMLIAGSLSDIFGRNRVMKLGLWGFGIASLICAFAPSGGVLIGARALQGVAGALLVPSSLAMIISAFSGEAQGKAIGTWTAWTGIAFLVGPLLGGFLVDISSWRWIFAINVAPIAVTLYLLSKLTPDKPRSKEVKLDVTGAFLSALGLGSSVYALIEHTRYGWGNPLIISTLVIGITALIAFLWHENKAEAPMLPLSLFRVRNFSAGNVATLFIYAALS